MLHACVERFNVTENLENFLVFGAKPKTRQCSWMLGPGEKRKQRKWSTDQEMLLQFFVDIQSQMLNNSFSKKKCSTTPRMKD